MVTYYELQETNYVTGRGTVGVPNTLFTHSDMNLVKGFANSRRPGFNVKWTDVIDDDTDKLVRVDGQYEDPTTHVWHEFCSIFPREVENA